MSLPVSRRLDFSEIPVIDVEPFMGDVAHAETIDQLRLACANVGFFYLKNHGIEQAVITKLHQQARLFFDQPMPEKEKIVIDQRIRGYLPLFYRSYQGEENSGISHQEGFWIGHETPIDPARPLDGPNQWLDYPGDLKTSMMTYFDQVEALSRVLHRGFAMALGLPADYFLAMHDNPTSRLKLNHYPPQANPESKNSIGVVPHTDSGGFTILWQDQRGGLEVQAKNGDWVGAPPIADTLVVNLGNIMQCWSNGGFSSTPHRVINRGTADRYSIPFFVNPDHAAVIAPAVSSPTPSFAPFVYGDYQVELWRRTFPVAKIKG